MVHAAVRRNDGENWLIFVALASHHIEEDIRNNFPRYNSGKLRRIPPQLARNLEGYHQAFQSLKRMERRHDPSRVIPGITTWCLGTLPSLAAIEQKLTA